ncbi:bifunctional riboflavin kinase/FAD synthetase [Agrococcus sp. SGAir0287]|uniref:bifunctional riboflavin kinase/FAD synthetase n=1 Tax=Agrococcus sp. SGAir0287 TaxID=2070347 RepID=UPI0010CCE46D|nr:bifunctional riboflavin kinase/FAD synthetase [Agrococcus sp. SGAir0287]QCR20788.1 bifunctional riboflavin kinase/FAD synthetase [Agrococcus sp. SGAir0287]
MSWIDDLVARPSAVTIGKFDGVHRGHRELLEGALRMAERRGLAPVVVTFDRHPLATLRPERAPRLILSPAQQREALEALGCEVVTIPFDAETAAMDPSEFVERVLLDGLGARFVVVGSDFRYGRGGAGDPALLTRLAAARGVEVLVVDDVVDDGGTRVSSTEIRRALEAGDIPHAASLLGRNPRLRGTVVRGFQRGRELGFPTANLGPDLEGFVPAHGVYAAWATVDAGRFPAAVSIGDNPTFDGVRTTVEAYLLDVDLDLYHRPIELELVDHVRDMWRFDGIEPLIAQMHADVERVREILGTPEGRADAPEEDTP